MATEKAYRFAVVGFGNIGRRHCQVIDGHPNCELVAVVDIDERLEKDVKATYNTSAFFNSVDALFLSNVEVDVVNICTPNGFHAIQALQALNFYCHVVMEKPMGLKAADCLRVIEQSKEVDRKVFCVMQNRYSPPAQWLRGVVDSGVLGQVFQVQVNCFWNRDHRYYSPGGWRGTMEYDGGPLFTQFSHFIDLMYWLFGDVSHIQAQFDNFNHTQSTEFDDSGFVSFRFKDSNALGAFNYSTNAYDQNLESSITILAEHGTIKVSGQYMEKVEYCHVKDYVMPELPLPGPPNTYAGGYKGSASNHHHLIENVIMTLDGHTTETTNALDGMKVVDIIERIYTLR